MTSEHIILMTMVLCGVQLLALGGIVVLLLATAGRKSGMNKGDIAKFSEILEQQKQRKEDLQPLLEKYKESADQSSDEVLSQLAARILAHISSHEDLLKDLNEKAGPDRVVKFLMAQSQESAELIEILSKKIAPKQG